MSEAPAGPDHARAAVRALVAMAREPGYDFPGRVAGVLASVAAELGSTEALVASRPGSWEAAALLDFVRSTVGYDDGALASYKLDMGEPS